MLESYLTLTNRIVVNFSATLNLMAGAFPIWLSRQMGHFGMQMLLNIYSRWIDGADKKKSE